MTKLAYKHTALACYLGYVTQAAVVNLSPILFIVFQTQFHISYEMIGRLVLINFGSQLLTELALVRHIDHIGIRRLAVAGHTLVILGFILMALLPRVMSLPYAGLVIADIVYAMGGGLIELVVSPTVDSLPGEAKDSAMSLLHSVYAWGQVLVMLLSTLFIRAFGAELWYLLPILWAVVPAGNALLFTRVPLMPAIPHHAKTPLRSLFAARIFILALLLMLCAGASEQAIAQWSSLFAEKGLGVPKLLGDLFGPVLFAGFMGVGRLAYGIWGERINLRPALIASSILCIACYLVTVFVRVQAIALMGMALTGLTVSLMWPGMLRLTSKTFPLGGTAMFGLLAIMGSVGCALGPWIAGAVSDAASRSSALLQIGASLALSPDQLALKAGILAAIIFPIGMLVGVLSFRKRTSAIASEETQALAKEQLDAG